MLDAWGTGYRQQLAIEKNKIGKLMWLKMFRLINLIIQVRRYQSWKKIAGDAYSAKNR